MAQDKRVELQEWRCCGYVLQATWSRGGGGWDLLKATRSKSQSHRPWVLWGTFKYPNIYWRSCTAICKQSRFLENIEKNATGSRWSHKEWCADWPHSNQQGSLVGDVEVGGSLGCSDPKTVELSVGWRGSRTASKMMTMDFSLFRDILGRITWELWLVESQELETTTSVC